MTDKEQESHHSDALVAAAYRAAADACELETVDGSVSLEDAAYNNALLHAAGAILTLSQADAEAKLRELMMGVAITMMNKIYGERAWVEEPLRQIVDEFLNETQ